MSDNDANVTDVPESNESDPIAAIPSTEEIRRLITESVRRTELLRHLLRVSRRREQLQIKDKSAGAG
jgi:hypothetical protein